jgi:histidinol-phosphate aminotransferase
MNENTAGCSPAVLAALARITAREVSQYPDYAEATARVERWLDVPAGWVQLTNGLDEGIHAVALGAGLNGEALIVEPAFEMYALSVAAAGGRATTMPPAPDFAFPTAALLAALSSSTRLVLLTDPNNPTGLPIPAGVIERILAAATAVGNALVVVDEAYADFSGRTSLSLLTRYRNLVIGRTFSKGHGLAGLRVGALVGHPDTLAPLRRVLPPYSVNLFATRALVAALDDDEYLPARLADAVASKELVYAFCDRLGLEYWRSESNFVLVRVGPRAPEIVAALAAEGIVIRDRSTQPGCAGCVRFTAAVGEHTRRCLAALEVALASRSN